MVGNLNHFLQFNFLEVKSVYIQEKIVIMLPVKQSSKLLPKTRWQYTNKAEEVWKTLSGLVTIYKPFGLSITNLRNQLKLHLCGDLNHLEVRPPEPYIAIQGETTEDFKVTVRESYADHVLVVGPRYQPEDIRMKVANYLTPRMSGVCVLGINDGVKMAHRLMLSKPISCYKVKGILGQTTNNCFIDGKIIEKSTFKHVKRHHIDTVCASIQSSRQRDMYEACGVDIQSQAAYDLAVQGLVKPINKEFPIFYAIKCVEFKSPEFTLELVGLGLREQDILSLVHTLGIQTRTSATCSMIQCYQYGLFTSVNALLKRQWELSEIVKNMRKTKMLFANNSDVFDKTDPIYREYMGLEQVAIPSKILKKPISHRIEIKDYDDMT